MKIRCSCLIRHATTDRQRERHESALEIAQRLGDSTGALLAQLALRPCPRVRKAAA